MTKPRPSELSESVVEETLLLNALGRIAHVLRPYPFEIKTPEKTQDELAVERAVAALRERGLVQGKETDPNLTRAGVEVAREILARKSDD
ncbi:MAG: hypothetical protein WCA78_15535 [Rhizomicrobium sp.]